MLPQALILAPGAQPSGDPVFLKALFSG